MSFIVGQLDQAIDTRRVLDDPVLFSKETLGVELWSKQREILRALWDGQRRRRAELSQCREDEGRGGGHAWVGGAAGWLHGYNGTELGAGSGTSSDQSGPVSAVCTKRDLTQRSTIVPLCLRVTFLLNVARVRYACTRHHPRSSRRSPRSPTGRRHCSSGRVRSSRPLTTGYHAMTSGDQMILSSQRPAGDQMIPSSPPPAPASATARRGLRMSQGRSGRACRLPSDDRTRASRAAG